MGFRGIDGNAAIVTYTAMCPAGIVEERCLSAVGISYKCHVDGTALAQGLVLHEVGFVTLHDQRFLQ